jgi:hypothetical protein
VPDPTQHNPDLLQQLRLNYPQELYSSGYGTSNCLRSNLNLLITPTSRWISFLDTGYPFFGSKILPLDTGYSHLWMLHTSPLGYWLSFLLDPQKISSFTYWLSTLECKHFIYRHWLSTLLDRSNFTFKTLAIPSFWIHLDFKFKHWLPTLLDAKFNL